MIDTIRTERDRLLTWMAEGILHLLKTQDRESRDQDLIDELRGAMGQFDQVAELDDD